MTESDTLAFTPLPATRHDGWTAERQRAFIAQLARCGVVVAAAKAIGMSAKSAYALRKRAGGESFGAAWDAAVAQGRHRALCDGIDRALNGVARPVFYRGRQVGEYRTYNDSLLIAAMRAIAAGKDTRHPPD